MDRSDVVDDVGVLRRFNRSFTPMIGVLGESFLDTGRPLAAARLLYEIGFAPVGVHLLRLRLGVDSGYLSRLLRNLEADDLISVRSDPDDGRRRVADLTEAGRVEWQQLDRRSHDIASKLLDRLASAERADLAAALSRAERLLHLAAVQFEIVDPASDAALDALTRYYAELDDRFSEGFDVNAPAAGADDAMMRAPFGGFMVIAERGEHRGCGGLQRLDDRTAEIKRMWLHPSMRGRGLGKALLEKLERLAAQLGYSAVVLDTNATLSEAISMYGAAGYKPIERYNDNPYAHHWFNKVL